MAVAVMDLAGLARFEIATGLVTEAGAVANEYFARVGELEVHSKGVQDVVTEADVQIELLLKRRIAEAFPGDAFLGEETGPSEIDGADGVWVVDPIDGTQPFVSGLVTWCVSVAYVRGGVLQFGLVVNPPMDELFVGGRGIPATLNGRPIAPHPGLAVTDGLVSVGYSPRITPDQVLPVLERLMRAGGIYHRNGSGALSLCYVACGRLLGYVEPHINSWDCLGAIAVIEAAGGRVNDFLTGDALLSGNRIIAGPVAVYDQLEQILGASTAESRSAARWP